MSVRTEIEEIHNSFVTSDREWRSAASSFSTDRYFNHEMADMYGFSFVESISVLSRGDILHSIVNDENWNNPESVTLMMDAYGLPHSRNAASVDELSYPYDYLSLRKEQGGVLASKCTSSGYDCLKRNCVGESLRYFDEALRFDGSLISALIGKAQALLEMGRAKDAIVELNAALSIDDSNDVAGGLLLEAYRHDTGLFTSTTTDARSAKRSASPAAGSSVSFIDKLRLSIGRKDGELKARHSARANSSCSSGDRGTARNCEEGAFLDMNSGPDSERASPHGRSACDGSSSSSDDSERSARKRRRRDRDSERKTEKKKRKSNSKRERKKDSKKEKRKKERRK